MILDKAKVASNRQVLHDILYEGEKKTQLKYKERSCPILRLSKDKFKS
jgi:hypothetical protein